MGRTYESAAGLQRPSHLEERLEGARLAFACPYSCSDEFEAATIAHRRAAGEYRETAPLRGMLWGGALAALVFALLVVL